MCTTEIYFSISNVNITKDSYNALQSAHRPQTLSQYRQYLPLKTLTPITHFQDWHQTLVHLYIYQHSRSPPHLRMDQTLSSHQYFTLTSTFWVLMISSLYKLLEFNCCYEFPESRDNLASFQIHDAIGMTLNDTRSQNTYD